MSSGSLQANYLNLQTPVASNNEINLIMNGLRNSSALIDLFINESMMSVFCCKLHMIANNNYCHYSFAEILNELSSSL